MCFVFVCGAASQAGHDDQEQAAESDAGGGLDSTTDGALDADAQNDPPFDGATDSGERDLDVVTEVPLLDSPIDGTQPTTLLRGLNYPTSLSQDDGRLYWLELGEASSPEVTVIVSWAETGGDRVVLAEVSDLRSFGRGHRLSPPGATRGLQHYEGRDLPYGVSRLPLEQW